MSEKKIVLQDELLNGFEDELNNRVLYGL